MDKVTASEAKQTFGNVLARAAVSPVAIERHGKVVAALVSPAWLERAQQWDERTHARREQKAVEQGRLMAHQRVAIALLSLPEPGRRRPPAGGPARGAALAGRPAVQPRLH